MKRYLPHIKNSINALKRISVAALCCATLLQASSQSVGYPISQVPFTKVKVAPESFWGQRLQASREVTIPLALSKCEATGRYTNFSKAATAMATGETFDIDPSTFPFDDTDPYKTIEGVSYLLQTYPDATLPNGRRLDEYVDSVVAVIASGQEPDGYLFTARTQNPAHPHPWAGRQRWVKVEDLSHELYNLGHLCEAAAAHYQATGKRNLLDVAIRYADCVCREVGPGEGQHCVVPGHQIAEMGLAKLYLATGNPKYLEQAKFFLDRRGYTTIRNSYSQSHKPVVEQDEAVGHAVRAGYMYAGMADIAALTGDSTYIAAIDRIWDNIVSRKYYLTGGVGALHDGEAFGANYQLPNLSAYCETCAAIAQVYLNYRLFLLHGDAKYYDALERTLYNGVLGGISIDGGSFYYPNPLASNGEHQRKPWFGCACCPSNASRFIPSLPQYVYAQRDKDLYVNLFCSNTLSTKVNGRDIELTQTTNYPWDGDVTLTIDKGKANYALHIRIPGWVRDEVVPSDLYRYADGLTPGYTVKVNGRKVNSELQNGYLVIDRRWRRGDKVEIHFDMEPRLVAANEAVEADRGSLAVERGPLVYCAEWPDNDFDLAETTIDATAAMMLGKAVISDTELTTITAGARVGGEACVEKLTLIPYYAWAHRGPGSMRVWLGSNE